MADKSAANLVADIDASKQTTLARFLYGLGIRHVGETTAKDLARHFGGSTGCMDAERRRSCSRCPTSARSSPRASATSSPSRTTARSSSSCCAAGFEWPESEGAADAAPQPLAGKTFVLTGTLPTLAREDAKEMIEALGGKVAGLGVEEDRLRRRRRRGRQQARQGARSSASPCSTRPALLALLDAR